MNAPVRIAKARQVAPNETPATCVAPEGEVLGAIEEFRLCCADQAWFLDLGIIQLQVAADNLQWLAERWGLIDLHGQDTIQAEMASAFTVPGEDIPLAPLPWPGQPGDLVRQWELADPRDRWKHTGELPPPESVRNSDIYRTPQATVNEFELIARRGDAVRLAKWLDAHPLDAPTLLRGWI